jgi:hypothetical protein
MSVITWAGNAQLTLIPNEAKGDRPVFDRIDVRTGGENIQVAALEAPGIWHRETLKPEFLEKDVELKWKPPFSAKWKTHLIEADTLTTFAFRDSKAQIWRGVPGSYDYPVWFDGDRTFIRLGKKIPPRGESIIYFIEARNTPAGISAPAAIIKDTLGRKAAEAILDPTGRKLRTHHRRAGDGVHRACTCGCTEAIQAIFEASDEVDRRPEITEALDDMVFFVQMHMARIQEYQKFAAGIISYLDEQAASSPSLKPYLEDLRSIAQRIPQEYDAQKENMKSLDHAAELTRKTLALTQAKNSNNLKAYLELLKEWRAMGGAQDYVVAQCHVIARKLAQEAGYSAVNNPKSVAIAEVVRKRCREVLRNADGYEIWADY